MGGREDLIARSEAERAHGILASGVLVFRWAALAWMVALAVTTEGGFERPWVAWSALGVAGAWTAWMTTAREPASVSLWIELAIAFGIVVASGAVAPEGSVVTERPFFGTGWPLAAVLAWGVARGARAGVLSALLIGGGLLLSRATNGIAPNALTGGQIGALANGTITFVIAGGAVGYVATLLRRSGEQYQRLVESMMHSRERAARLEERASLARRIHDSVLQALALVHKRGRELGARETVPGPEVGRLAEMAGEQEAELRALIQREPEEAPIGTTSLRAALEEAARMVGSPPVDVSATGPMWLPARVGEEICAAVRQALDNVSRHAEASRATVFADIEDGAVTVTVRDDGHGFDYDEPRLRGAGKLGILQSMKGRVEALGGTMVIDSTPEGTEVEFRVPLEAG